MSGLDDEDNGLADGADGFVDEGEWVHDPGAHLTRAGAAGTDFWPADDDDAIVPAQP